MQQAGTFTVGSSNTDLHTVSVTFSQPFAAAPVVIANTLQDPNYPVGPLTDTFAVSITKTSATGFSANIYRVDAHPAQPGTGWGQNLQLGYLATT